ncbi:Mitochondrial 2-oxoadipate and 2-oxoglutarate transporter [Mactra antiquata]
MKTFVTKNCPVDLLPFEKSTPALIEEQVAQSLREGCDEPFLICNLGDVIQKYKRWVQLLPRVKPFYAVKCNDDLAVLKVLADCGANFDCASKNEIQKVLSLDINADRIIYANPCKQASMLKYAAKHDVEMMTFDNEAELHKVKALYPQAKLVLRILPPSNFKVQCELGIKFGCHPSKALPLLQTAQALGLNVMGVSFHVGSGCAEAGAFDVAIQQARQVFDLAVEMGFDMSLLDIGGGYPGTDNAPITFSEIAEVINVALDKYFPEDSNIEVIAEPGRYMIASAITIGVNIIAKRIVARDQHGENGELMDAPTMSDEPAIMYYVNDGVYGSFNCVLFDHQVVSACSLKSSKDEMTYESSIWGPTCDGIDCIMQTVQLPMHDVGEWFYFEDMGAYTVSAASTFNGMDGPARKYYYCLQSDWQQKLPQPVKAAVGIPIKKVPAMKTGHSLKDTYLSSSLIEDQSSSFNESIMFGDLEWVQN